MSLTPELRASLEERIAAAVAEPDRLEDESPWVEAVYQTLAFLDCGELRVAEKLPDEQRQGVEWDETWVVNTWVQQAILFYFRLAKMRVIEIEPFEYYDKIPLKRGFEALGVRVVPPARVRYGSFIERGTVLMPGYVNIGAYVGANSMVDTWATVGSGAQIGCNVHLSGGVGIGGVLEPPGARPVIIEDGAFIGSRSIVVEGVMVQEQAVLGANVVLTASTPIIDVTGSEELIYRGCVPPRSVVIPGMREKQFPAGTYLTPCALIIGRRRRSTNLKTSLNAVLREFAVSV